VDFLDQLQAEILCGDGAMGTLLLEAGIPLERCFEELCLNEPERIETIHLQYISAGARVIETNSFGGNAARLERFGLENRVVEINRAAAQVAVRAAQGKDVYVAGSVGPLGLGAHEAAARGIDRAVCFREQISALLEGGVHLIFFETFMDLEEMTVALSAKMTVSDCVALCSFACAPEGQLASGTPLVEAFQKLTELGAQIVGVNCMNDPHAMVQLLQRVPTDYLLAAYPNAGCPKYQEGRFIYHTAPDNFAEAAREMVAQGARLIGGCCGTNPRDIAAIATAIANLKPIRSKVGRVAAEPALPRPPRG
jgi:methionine synthase I (cobalamin-dependent)